LGKGSSYGARAGEDKQSRRAGPLYGIESIRGATIMVNENEYPLPVIHTVDREMATIRDMLQIMPLDSIEIVIEGKERDKMTPEELAHDTRKTASFPATKAGLKQARQALLKRAFEIWKAEPESAYLRCPFCHTVFTTTLELLNADRCPACGDLFGDEDEWLYPGEE